MNDKIEKLLLAAATVVIIDANIVNLNKERFWVRLSLEIWNKRNDLMRK